MLYMDVQHIWQVRTVTIPKPKCPECGAKAQDRVPGPFGAMVSVIVDYGDRLCCRSCGHEWERSQGH
jgi:ribosomal protein S27AE